MDPSTQTKTLGNLHFIDLTYIRPSSTSQQLKYGSGSVLNGSL